VLLTSSLDSTSK